MLSNLSPKEIVGNNIKHIRLEKGLSGSDLAKLLFYSQQHISRIERGLIRLNLEQIQYISNCLNININKLLYGIGFGHNYLKYVEIMELYFKAEEIIIYNEQS